MSAMHVTNDELLYTHKSQGNAIHINTFYICVMDF